MKSIIYIILVAVIIYLKRKNSKLSLNNYRLNNRIKELEDKPNTYIKQADQRTFQEKLDGKRISAEKYYIKKKKFWDSESERIIFEKVKKDLPSKFVIIPHISLREIFKHKFDEKEGFKNLSYYHVDMLICSKEYMTPLMVIEFDGEGHKRDDQALRDAFKDSLFRMAKIPLVRVFDKDVDQKELYDFIKNEFQIAKLCKKCGSPMVMENGKYGDFYGCSNFDHGDCCYTEKIKTEWF